MKTKPKHKTIECLSEALPRSSQFKRQNETPSRSSQLKGQGQMLEYLLLMVFVVAVILMLMMFLTWWQISQLGVERAKNQQEWSLSMLKQFTDSPYMTKENSMFDDAKLTALASMMPDGCQRLQEFYGDNWYAEIRLMDDEPVTECSQSNYPECNYWKICEQYPDAEGRVTRVAPVNIYRNIGFVLDVTNAVLPRTYIGTLTLTVYY